MKITYEKVAITGAAASLLGGVAYVLSKRSNNEAPPKLDILNNPVIPEPRRQMLNRVALFIITSRLPDRKKLMNEFGISKHVTDHNTGFLKHYGLIDRVPQQTKLNIPPHYIPAEELVATLNMPEQFPGIELALKEQLERNTHKQ